MKLPALTALALTIVAFSQCNSNSASDEKKAAEEALKNSALECYNEAVAALETGNADLCMQLLDSISNNFSKDAAVMDSVLGLYPRAMVIQAENNLLTTDESIASIEARLDSLKSLMTHVEVKGTPGYYEARTSHNPNFSSSTGISARVNENADFVIVTNVADNAGHESITLVADNISIDSDTIPASNDRNFQRGGIETITFMYDESDPLGAFIVDNRDKAVKVIFNGKKPRTITLTAKQIDGIATAHLYSETALELRNLVLERERLNRHIEVARNKM